MDRVKFLTDNLESDAQVQLSPHEKIINLGYFCKSHLDLINGNSEFVKKIAQYRIDKCMAAVNSGNN